MDFTLRRSGGAIRRYRGAPLECPDGHMRHVDGSNDNPRVG